MPPHSESLPFGSCTSGGSTKFGHIVQHQWGVEARGFYPARDHSPALSISQRSAPKPAVEKSRKTYREGPFSPPLLGGAIVNDQYRHNMVSTSLMCRSSLADLSSSKQMGEKFAHRGPCSILRFSFHGRGWCSTGYLFVFGCVSSSAAWIKSLHPQLMSAHHTSPLRPQGEDLLKVSS